MRQAKPFTTQTIKKIFQPWLNAISQKECASIINIPKRDQLYRLRQFLTKYKIKKPLILDLAAEPLEDPPDIRARLNKHSLVFVLDADLLLGEKNSFLAYLNQIYFQKNISIIYFFQKNITSQKIITKLSPYSTLFHNIHVYSFFSAKDMSLFCLYMEKFFKITLPKAIRKIILEQCGSSPWLIKQAVRYFSQTKDIKNLLSHDQMELKLNVLYEELAVEEKEVLEKILKKNLDFNLMEKQILKYLIKTGLIAQRNQSYYLTIPLLTDFVKRQIARKNSLNINARGDITINNLILTGFFSPNEKRLLKGFLKNPDQIISREDTASYLWGKDNPNYSDWALDQVIRRLRIKLLKLGLEKKTISTIKNKGFRL